MIRIFYFRLILYLSVFLIYLFFMSNYSPLGINWLNWHSQRIYNFSEYLNLNGFFSSYGFSVWSTCIDCSLNSENFNENIYFSLSFFSHLPHVILNKFFGEINLKLYGHYIDKSLIIFTGILISELIIYFLRKKISLYERIFLSQLIFVFFIVNPWTYKMILAHWTHVYFVFFFFLGILMFSKKKNTSGFVMFFLAGCFEYQSSAGLFLFYFIIFIYSKIQRKNYLINFFYSNDKKNFFELKLLMSFLLPVAIFFSFKFLAAENLNYINSGSSLLERIGISGNDIHNGGLLGSIQFLGGNRITHCFVDVDYNLVSMMDLTKKIEIFNCSMSILSMFLISLISVYGLFISYSYEQKNISTLLLPVLFLLLSYTFILQQSSSVHLMGYSYYFSVLFSVGISFLIFKILKKFNYSIISNIIASPIILGIIILCIRVNMLTGING